jgi:hypothetical protein
VQIFALLIIALREQIQHWPTNSTEMSQVTYREDV